MRYIHTYIHTHTYIYIYVHIHTHTHTHTMEYYSDTKKNEILTFAAIWMYLEIIILSKSEKDKYMISLICGS